MSFLIHTGEKNNADIEKYVKVFVKEMDYSFKNFNFCEKFVDNENFNPVFIK